VDESGLDSSFHREYGYAPRGELVHGRIRGHKYARTGIAAAEIGEKILAPYKYKGTMDHAMFEDWFENKLLPVLPDGTVIVMDNAAFHRKEQLHFLAKKHGYSVIFTFIFA